jgi:lipoprotein signal peptidase
MKHNIFNNSLIWSTILLGGLFGCDQLLKYIARTNPNLYLDSPLASFGLYKNPGVAFGLGVPQSILLILTPILFVALAAYIMHSKCTIQKIALISVIIGAISNYIDRVLFAHTIDYLHLFTLVINIADIMITCGGVLFLIFEIQKNKQIS